jgi:hypothetical protein
VSAVLVPSYLAGNPAVEHPWVSAVRVDAPPRAAASRNTTVRVVPSAAGLEVVRAHGRAYFVGVLAALYPRLPAESRAWRLVDDLDDASADAEDALDRPRVRCVSIVSACVLEARLFVPYDLRVFEGHFHSIPLVPGVVQIAWALGLAEGRLAGIGRLRGIQAVKFRRLVRPGMELQYALQWSASNRQLQFESRHAGLTTAAGRLCMTGADD